MFWRIRRIKGRKGAQGAGQFIRIKLHYGATVPEVRNNSFPIAKYVNVIRSNVIYVYVMVIYIR